MFSGPCEPDELWDAYLVTGPELRRLIRQSGFLKGLHWASSDQIRYKLAFRDLRF